MYIKGKEFKQEIRSKRVRKNILKMEMKQDREEQKPNAISDCMGI